MLSGWFDWILSCLLSFTAANWVFSCCLDPSISSSYLPDTRSTKPYFLSHGFLFSFFLSVIRFPLLWLFLSLSLHQLDIIIANNLPPPAYIMHYLLQWGLFLSRNSELRRWKSTLGWMLNHPGSNGEESLLCFIWFSREHLWQTWYLTKELTENASRKIIFHVITSFCVFPAHGAGYVRI